MFRISNTKLIFASRRFSAFVVVRLNDPVFLTFLVYAIIIFATSLATTQRFHNAESNPHKYLSKVENAQSLHFRFDVPATFVQVLADRICQGLEHFFNKIIVYYTYSGLRHLFTAQKSHDES